MAMGSAHDGSGSAFARQVATEPPGGADGRYRVDLDEAWNCPYVPHGGLIAAITAGAMDAELGDPSQGLRSMTAMFAAPVLPGPAEIDVTMLRRGRSSSNLSASLRSVGKDVGLSAIAFFGARRPGLEFVDVSPPDVPPPQDCPRFRDDPSPHGNFWYMVDGRTAKGHRRGEVWEPTTSECAFWYRFDEPPMSPDGTLDPLALVTLCDTMPMAVGERTGPVDFHWEVVSVDLTVHLLGETRSEWILGVNRARFAGDGYVSVENELWDEAGNLVAYGTEVQVVRISDPRRRRLIDSMARRWVASHWHASLYRQLAVVMWRSSPGLTLLFAVGVIAASGLAVGFILAIGGVVGSLPAAIDHGPGSPAARHTEAVLVVVGVLLLTQQLVAALQASTTPTLGRRVEGTVRQRVMASALAPFGVLHLEDADTAGAIYAATTLGSARNGPMLAVESMQPMLQSLLTGLGMAAVVGAFRWWLGVALAGAWLVARDCRRRDNIAQSQMIGSDVFGTRRQAYFRQLALTPDGGKELRVFGLSAWLVERFHQQWLESAQALWTVRRQSRPTLLWPVALLLVVNAGAFTVIGHAAQTGEIGLRGLTILLQATLGVAQLSEPGGTILVDPMFVHGAGTLAVATRLEQRLGTLGPQPPSTSEPVPVITSIGFEDVSFRYPSRPAPVLDHLDLVIPAGRSLAIVGENGAGKTTLVKLLCGLVVPSEGAITVDGEPREGLDQEAWRASLAVVFQNFTQFQLSARENVIVGLGDRPMDDAQLDDVAERAGLSPVLGDLPSGWDTPLSRQLRNGTDLSGGQWQRLALARALAAIDTGACVLVLDEPTANFDVRAEAAFYEAFLELTQGSLPSSSPTGSPPSVGPTPSVFSRAAASLSWEVMTS